MATLGRCSSRSNYYTSESESVMGSLGVAIACSASGSCRLGKRPPLIYAEYQ
jgi:hypothetical protein